VSTAWPGPEPGDNGPVLRWLLLLAVPLALGLELLGGAGSWVFGLSLLALLPLAGWMGEATEELAARAGATVGGLLNASFGNAAELIVGAVALSAGKVAVVKASITGSILSNLLLVLGLSVFLGGLRHHTQRFNKATAGLLATLLVLATIALALPALFDYGARSYFRLARPAGADLAYSLAVAGVLVAAYLANLVFSLVTHRDLVGAPLEGRPPRWSARRALGVLLLSTLGVAAMSELLVRHLEAATRELGLSEFFVGIVLIPLVGNAAEHLAAVGFAIRDRVELTVQIALGSSLQIALLVAPLLVLFGFLVGRPMDLVFQNPLELGGLIASVLITNAVVQDAQTHWLEGILLLGVYLLLAFAFLLV